MASTLKTLVNANRFWFPIKKSLGAFLPLHPVRISCVSSIGDAHGNPTLNKRAEKCDEYTEMQYSRKPLESISGNAPGNNEDGAHATPTEETKNDDGSKKGTSLYEGDAEKLKPDELKQKQDLIKELTKRLSGPLADKDGNVPTGKDRPIAIEVDGPSHFYANSTRYTAYTKLKHRLLSRMGYKVLHVPYFEWRKLRGAKEREEYMKTKLGEEPSEWLDPEDEKFYEARTAALEKQFAATNTAN